MFKAIGRWIKAVGYLLTGQIDSARRVLDTNPHVIRAKYDAIVEEKIARIHQYKQAVAGLIAQEEKKTQQNQALERGGTESGTSQGRGAGQGQTNRGSSQSIGIR